MENIYCLIYNGHALTNELRNFLLTSAQNMMRDNSRKERLKLPSLKLTGLITTRYKLNMMGSTCGFVFTAEMEWDEGTVKTDFIVKPVSQKFLDKMMKDIKWVRSNSEFIPQPNPLWN